MFKLCNVQIKIDIIFELKIRIYLLVILLKSTQALKYLINEYFTIFCSKVISILIFTTRPYLLYMINFLKHC